MGRTPDFVTFYVMTRCPAVAVAEAGVGALSQYFAIVWLFVEADSSSAEYLLLIEIVICSPLVMKVILSLVGVLQCFCENSV